MTGLTEAQKKILRESIKRIKKPNRIPYSPTTLEYVTLRSAATNVLHRYEELQAIVDKLPKTADGVVVVPGMTLWAVDTEGETLEIDYNEYGPWIKSVECEQWDLMETTYSTREAAEAGGDQSTPSTK